MSIRDDAGEVSIQIEEYKRPQFEVKLDTLKSSFRLNEKIIQTGKATTYSGAALNNATVKYRVQRQAIFPIWMWWKPYLFSPAAEITNGTTTTDGNGNFKFDFTALPDLKIAAKDKPEFSYTITTDVTSQSGETQSTQTIINIGYTALRAEISIPELLDNSAAQTLQINTSNLSGQKVNVNGNVKIEKLEEPNQALRSRLWEAPDKPVLSRDEYKKHFPQDVYMDEDKVYNYPVEKTINEQSLSSNSAINFTEQEMKNWSAGNYKITCTAKDVFGETVESIKYIKVYDAKSKKAAFVTPSYFIAHKASNLKPGEKAVFIWGTAAKASAHIVAAHKGKVVFDKWISSKGGQQRIEIPVTEEYRGGLFVKLTTMIDNRLYQYSEKSDVPFPDRKLEITTAVWRDKTKPGAKETWTFNIKGPNAEKAVAEMLAGMYDASLDAFVPHKWNFEIDPYTYPMIYINALGLGGVNEGFSRYDGYGNNFSGWQLRSYDELIYNENQGFGGRIIFNLNQVRDGAYRNIKSMAKTSNGVIGETSFSPPTLQDQSQEMQQKPPTQIRKNKQETVFFYPQLRTNESGDVSFEFTMPDALTRWKFMAFAHTKDLKFGTYESAIITQKELMVQPNLPRFLRAGDEIEFSANATNLSGETQKGEVRIKLFDAYSMKYLGDEILENKTLENKTSAQQSISLKNGETKNIVWKIKTPANTDGIMYQLIASAGKFSDGEEGVIPVLPNRMLVTETQPLYVRGNASKTFNFNPLLNLSKSKTAAPYKLTMEIASNPAWFAVQSLPYLMENPYENAENVFNRLFANTLSQQIVKNNPQIKQVFESWKSGTALQSDLEKNTELKNILLQETPWLAEGRNETERKQRIGLLFDENNMNMNLENAVSKLEQMQQPDGGWPWFDGMQTDRFITQYIITGLGRIEKMEIRNDYMERMRAMMIKAVIYMDEQMLADHENIKKIHPKTVDENHLSSIIVQYFYARSYFKMVPMQRKYQYAYVYWQKQGKKYWTSLNLQQKAMYALALNMIDNDHDAHEIIESINEYALHSEEMGMYWKENTTGYNWHQQPTVTQSILIEAFNDIEDDKAAVEEMKLWLLKQKQTQSWESTKATADAVYALLMNGTNSLATQKNVKVFLGDKLYIPSPEIKTEQGTGYYKTSWSGKEIKPEQGKIKLEKQDDGAAWGAMYYQYFEDINAVKANSGSLSITKDLFIKENSPNGPVLKPISASQPLKTGDLVTVRIRVKTDRNMEYVHVKDMRAAALEPTETISGYQWKSNLGYYQSVKDASMNFFIGYLPKGEYTFEYTLRASQAGTFTNGISQVQCFYAPQFSGQSGSVKLNIK
ncbi:MAG: hypothetical protein EOP53_05930 [Sphingobacteriales bacterium]|nr:MAG: hypothetical protein EOP53_05930 [Sphingobacteriales bacterium]